jgi:hypothetical protein
LNGAPKEVDGSCVGIFACLLTGVEISELKAPWSVSPKFTLRMQPAIKVSGVVRSVLRHVHLEAEAWRRLRVVESARSAWTGLEPSPARVECRASSSVDGSSPGARIAGQQLWSITPDGEWISGSRASPTGGKPSCGSSGR